MKGPRETLGSPWALLAIRVAETNKITERPSSTPLDTPRRTGLLDVPRLATCQAGGGRSQGGYRH
jgi:hypothetical protein